MAVRSLCSRVGVLLALVAFQHLTIWLVAELSFRSGSLRRGPPDCQCHGTAVGLVCAACSRQF